MPQSYYSYMLSRSPNLWFPYSNDIYDKIGNATIYSVYNGLDPVIDYTMKPHLRASKKIGHLGSGSYDTNLYALSSANSYIYHIYMEAWVYIPTSTRTDLTILSDIRHNPTSTVNLEFSITAARSIRFYSRHGSGRTVNNLYSATSVPFDTWTHVAIHGEYNSSTGNMTKKVFINGTWQNEVTVSSGIYNVGPAYIYDSFYSAQTAWSNNLAMWISSSTTKPTGFPDQSSALAAYNFPRTKTKWWDATTQQWLTSADEQYWHPGGYWDSMQQLQYKVWNGTEWVNL